MINFFCERHGKNSRDAHFSNVSRFLKHESYKRRLISASSVNTAILERQRSSNEERENSLLILDYTLIFIVKLILFSIL